MCVCYATIYSVTTSQKANDTTSKIHVSEHSQIIYYVCVLMIVTSGGYEVVISDGKIHQFAPLLLGMRVFLE